MCCLFSVEDAGNACISRQCYELPELSWVKIGYSAFGLDATSCTRDTCEYGRVLTEAIRERGVEIGQKTEISFWSGTDMTGIMAGGGVLNRAQTRHRCTLVHLTACLQTRPATTHFPTHSRWLKSRPKIELHLTLSLTVSLDLWPSGPLAPALSKEPSHVSRTWERLKEQELYTHSTGSPVAPQRL